MIIEKTTIDVGAASPFKALNLSDSHLCLADHRDGQRKVDLAIRRNAAFAHGGKTSLDLLKEHLGYIRDHALPVLYTGDMIDFVSLKNLETAKALLEGIDFFTAAGNHEFSLYVGEAFEDVPYKMQSYDLVQSYFDNDLSFASRVMGGVNFVAVDNSYYLFSEKQLGQLKTEAGKGLPIVLMLHVPIHTDALYRHMMDVRKQPCAYLCGTPEAMLKPYTPDRAVQQRADDATNAFIEYVSHERLIRAILAGHLHCAWEGELPCGIPQYVCDGGYRDWGREITFV